MRRSAQVFAPLLAATAVALTGCHHPDPQRCVDNNNRVVDPKFCASLPPGSQQMVPGTLGNGGGYYGGNGIFIPYMYRNYYGGMGGFAPGTVVSGGSYAPLAGHSYASPSGTTRGGFGESFSSSSHGSSSSGSSGE